MYKKTVIFAAVFISLLFVFGHKVRAGNEACTNTLLPVCYPKRSYTEYNCVAAVSVGKFCTSSVGNNNGVSCFGTASDYCSTNFPDYYRCADWYIGGDGTYTTNPDGGCNLVWSDYLFCNTDLYHCEATISNYYGCDQQCVACGCSTTPTTKVFGCCGPGTVTPIPTVPGTTPSPPPTPIPGSCTCPQDTYPNCNTTISCINCVAPDICDQATCDGGICHHPAATCTSAAPQNPTTRATTGNFLVYAYGITNATAVQFKVSSQAGVDNQAVTYTGVLSGNTYIGTMDLSKHTGVGTFYIHTYVTDLYGTSRDISACATTFTRLPPIVAWWQVKDSDVLANGNIMSSIPVPSSLYFDVAGDNVTSFPGVPMYRDTTNLTAGNVSAKSWIANSGYITSKSYNAEYFIGAIPTAATINQVPSSSEPISFFASGGTAYNGYYYYEYNAPSPGLTFNITSSANPSINATDANRKVILIINGASLNISGGIHLTKGSGFFMAVTTGDLTIDPTVGGGSSASLEGIFVADGTFRSGTGGTKTDKQLWIRGTVAAYTGAVLQRDMGETANTTAPAELFEYAPDLELLFPGDLASHVTKWTEVAP